MKTSRIQVWATKNEALEFCSNIRDTTVIETVAGFIVTLKAHKVFYYLSDDSWIDWEAVTLRDKAELALQKS